MGIRDTGRGADICTYRVFHQLIRKRVCTGGKVIFTEATPSITKSPSFGVFSSLTFYSMYAVSKKFNSQLFYVQAAKILDKTYLQLKKEIDTNKKNQWLTQLYSNFEVGICLFSKKSNCSFFKSGFTYRFQKLLVNPIKRFVKNERIQGNSDKSSG